MLQVSIVIFSIKKINKTKNTTEVPVTDMLKISMSQLPTMKDPITDNV